jgi:hypothetical protein
LRLGRPRHRNRCENCLAIDVRQLHREGRLRPHQSFPITWQCGDQPFGGIAVRTDHDLLILRFQVRETDAKDQKLVEQNVPIVWTPCSLGGRRPWFQCKTVSAGFSCNRRAAKIYVGSGSGFACRRCYGLAYTSPADSAFHRDIAKAMKIRIRLGEVPICSTRFLQGQRVFTELLMSASGGHMTQQKAAFCNGRIPPPYDSVLLVACRTRDPVCPQASHKRTTSYDGGLKIKVSEL